MDKRELIPFSAIVQALDTDYGKRTPKHLASFRVELGESVAVAFKNTDAILKNRLLLSRLTRDARKIRIFLEPGDFIKISRRKDDIEHSEYYAVSYGPRNVILSTVAGPSFNEIIDHKQFTGINDGRVSIAARTLQTSMNVLVGTDLYPLLQKVNTLAGVNLIFENNPTPAVVKRCNWFAPYNVVVENNTHGKRMVGWANPDFKDLKVPANQYCVGLDMETHAIRVYCDDATKEHVLNKLKSRNIYNSPHAGIHRLLVDPSNDLVVLGFEETT